MSQTRVCRRSQSARRPSTNHGPDSPTGVYVGFDDAFSGFTPRAFGDAGDTPLTKVEYRLIQVPAGFLQGFLAIHDPRAGLFAQCPD